MVKKISYYEEFCSRGLTIVQASMLIEAISSCAIEGIPMPTTKEQLDSLVKRVLEDD